MDPNISQNLTLTTDSVPWGPFSSQPDGFDDFSALFDSSDATSEPLDSTTFAEAQGLRMMTEFYHIQNSFIEFTSDRSSCESHTDDQDQSTSVSSGVVAEEPGGRRSPSHLVVDGPTTIVNIDRAAVLETNALSLSQITALKIEPMSQERPELAMSQVTASEVRPKVPPRLVLAMSQVTTLDLKPMSPEMSTMIIPPITTLDLSHKVRRAPSLETSRAAASGSKLASASATEVLMPRPLDRNRSESDLAAAHTHSSGTDEASQSSAERTKGLLGSSDHPIVICDESTDEETERKLPKHVDQPFVDVDRCEELQRDKQPYPRKSKGRMRSSTERKGVVQWAQYEQKIFCELREACHSQVAYWERVRDLPDLATNARVQQHDTLVQKMIEMARDTRTMLPDDVDELRKSYTELRYQIEPKLENEEEKHLLKGLSQTLDVVHNRSEIARTIHLQYRSRDDKEDGTYRPSKRQRRL